MKALRAIATLGLGLASMVLLPNATAQAATTCQGQPATIEASSGDVTGTSGDDVIVATGTVTKVDAQQGDDLVCLVDTVEMDAWLEIHAGEGDDAIDATAALARVTTSLGAGSDTYLGSPFADLVGMGLGGWPYDEGPDTGTDVVTTGAGDDELAVFPGVVLHADLGAGDDYVNFWTTYAGEGSTFDLGPGSDSLRFQDDFEELRDAGETTLRANLRSGVLVWRGVRSVLRGAEGLSAVARRIVVRGDAEANEIYTTGCHITLKGRGGDDRLHMRISHSGDEMPFRCGKNNKQGSWRALGNGGDDLLHGGNQHDVLIGGPGQDVADGHKHGDDRCVAERVRGQGCKG
jgi:Ca2+-binding RTX toxin-like protein